MNSCGIMNEIQHISAKINQLELFILFEERLTSRREPTRVIFCRVVESYYLIQMKI